MYFFLDLMHFSMVDGFIFFIGTICCGFYLIFFHWDLASLILVYTYIGISSTFTSCVNIYTIFQNLSEFARIWSFLDLNLEIGLMMFVAHLMFFESSFELLILSGSGIIEWNSFRIPSSKDG